VGGGEVCVRVCMRGGGVHGVQLEWKQVSLHKYFMWISKNDDGWHCCTEFNAICAQVPVRVPCSQEVSPYSPPFLSTGLPAA